MHRIGFMGLGTMGLPMAVNMAKTGLELMVYNRTPGKAAPALEAGAVEATSVKALFEWSDTVVMMLSGPEAIGAILDPMIEDQPGLLHGRAFMNMGTNPPSFSRQLAVRLESVGAAFVDAPVSGTRVQAEQGDLLVMTSGPKDVIDSLTPLFSAVGHKIVHCGDVPNSGLMKLAVNIVLSASISGLVEGTHFAEKAGLDLTTFFGLILGGPLKNDMFAIKARKLIELDFSPQASIGTVREMLKHIMDTAYEINASIPNTLSNMNLITAATNLGLAGEDACAIIRVFSREDKAQQEEGAHP